MKIEKSQEELTLPFNTLNFGDVFIWDTETYMKVDMKEPLNAVRLRDGHPYLFGNNLVTPKNAVLVLK